MSSQQIRQDLKTSLRLNSALTQSIKTLQLSSQELEDYIEVQILENPFLSKEDNEEEIENLYDKRVSSKNYEGNFDEISNIESEISLKEHVLRQIPYVIEEDNLLIAQYLTDFLDDNGYLKLDLKDASKILKVELELLENILEQLQMLDPSGVFARSLEECIKIQLQDKNIYSDTHKVILEHINIIATGDIQKLTKLAKLDIESTRKIVQDIKLVEPKPGRNFCPKNVAVKIPDVYIRLDENGEVFASSNREVNPVVVVNKEYYARMSEKLSVENDKNLISEMYRSANNVAKSVEMRAKTILIVANAISKEQEEFFKRGIMYLKPLTLSRIAEITGYDESTISRATSNKYASTPYGVLDMKYFFSSGVKSKYSKEEVSSHKVKEIIKTLINDEDKRAPLSDEEIATQLRQFNIIAARRTVAKYREAIKIPPSSKRRLYQ
jgi:RNA polymerase sigma-54 factor